MEVVLLDCGSPNLSTSPNCSKMTLKACTGNRVIQVTPRSVDERPRMKPVDTTTLISSPMARDPSLHSSFQAFLRFVESCSL